MSFKDFKQAVFKEISRLADLSVSTAANVRDEFESDDQQTKLRYLHADHVSVREAAEILMELYQP